MKKYLNISQKINIMIIYVYDYECKKLCLSSIIFILVLCYYEKKVQTYVNQKQKGRKILGLGMFSHTITFLLPQ